MSFHDFLAVVVLLLGGLSFTLLVIWLLNWWIRRNSVAPQDFPHDGLADLRERLIAREEAAQLTDEIFAAFGEDAIASFRKDLEEDR